MSKTKMSSERIFNFSAGPSMMPLEVLQEAQREMLSLGGIGMSVMEISHRSKHFTAIIESATQNVRELLAVPENYQILFLQGGASLQFAMIPLNFLRTSADYITTGAWGQKAVNEAKRRGNVNTIFSGETDGFKIAAKQNEIRFSTDADYVHYVSNETIQGVEFKYDLDAAGVPVVCDASSNILSKPIDVSKYAFIYAGAQKNIGSAGVTLVIIRDDMLARVPENQFAMLDYRHFAENASLPNTPNTWGIYLVDLVCKWIKNRGGLSAMKILNEEKAKTLYDAIDSSDGYFIGHAARDSRSVMNVTFRLPSVELENKFCSEATSAGLDGLAGHKTFGGIRASIYNACPREGVEALVEFMKDFAQKNG